jgi:hypothetical protein
MPDFSDEIDLKRRATATSGGSMRNTDLSIMAPQNLVNKQRLTSLFGGQLASKNLTIFKARLDEDLKTL